MKTFETKTSFEHNYVNEPAVGTRIWSAIVNHQRSSMITGTAEKERPTVSDSSKYPTEHRNGKRKKRLTVSDSLLSSILEDEERDHRSSKKPIQPYQTVWKDSILRSGSCFVTPPPNIEPRERGRRRWGREKRRARREAPAAAEERQYSPRKDGLCEGFKDRLAAASWNVIFSERLSVHR